MSYCTAWILFYHAPYSLYASHPSIILIMTPPIYYILFPGIAMCFTPHPTPSPVTPFPTGGFPTSQPTSYDSYDISSLEQFCNATGCKNSGKVRIYIYVYIYTYILYIYIVRTVLICTYIPIPIHTPILLYTHTNIGILILTFAHILTCTSTHVLKFPTVR